MTQANATPGAVRLSFADEDAWTIETSGPYWAHVDRRALLNAFYPLVPGEAGALASATRQVPIPAHWSPPFVLHFYCTVDYHIPDGPPP